MSFDYSQSSSESESSKKSIDDPDFYISKKDFINKYNNPYILNKDKVYTLNADMITGWRPKQINNFPIPLLFKSRFDDEIQELRQIQCKSLVFIGFRPNNSYVLHRAYANKDSYNYQFPTDLFNNKEFYEEAFSGNLQNNELQFDSKFECGNLDFVVNPKENIYNLYMRVDSNTRGHTQWFYFRIKNQKAKKYTFNICNFYKKKSNYQIGMKIYVKSSKSQSDWKQEGEQVSYGIFDCNSQKKIYHLSFQYQFLYDDDEVYFAYCIPYTYSQMLKDISNWVSNNPSIIKQSSLCQTLSGIDCPILTLTNNNQDNKKKTILISSRIHPGETNSSYVMKGLINYLLSPQANFLRNNIIFKIIPMINPDGVILGNYRTGFAGYDLNRQYKDQSEGLTPTIKHIMQMSQDLYQTLKDNFIMYLDLHGHSVKKNVFAYGPEYPMHDANYFACRILPKMLAQTCESFRYYQSKFACSAKKKFTGRSFVARVCNLVNCFTIESSFGIYLDKNMHCVHFDESEFQNVGLGIGRGLNQYIDLILIKYDQYYQKHKQQQQKIEIQKKQNRPKSERKQPVKTQQSNKKMFYQIMMEDILINEQMPQDINSDYEDIEHTDSESSDEDLDNDQKKLFVTKLQLNMKSCESKNNSPKKVKKNKKEKKNKIIKTKKEEKKKIQQSETPQNKTLNDRKFFRLNTVNGNSHVNTPIYNLDEAGKKEFKQEIKKQTYKQKEIQKDENEQKKNFISKPKQIEFVEEQTQKQKEIKITNQRIRQKPTSLSTTNTTQYQQSFQQRQKPSTQFINNNLQVYKIQTTQNKENNEIQTFQQLQQKLKPNTQIEFMANLNNQFEQKNITNKNIPIKKLDIDTITLFKPNQNPQFANKDLPHRNYIKKKHRIKIDDFIRDFM